MRPWAVSIFYVRIFIYIYIERERERYTHICIYTYIYIFIIYIHIVAYLFLDYCLSGAYLLPFVCQNPNPLSLEASIIVYLTYAAKQGGITIAMLRNDKTNINM